MGIAWGFLYGFDGVPAEKYMPKLRQMGGGFTKIYLLWQQVEPTQGKYDWTAVDAFVGQLKSRDEGLISIFSSSTWATKLPSAMIPASPANKADDYYRFIYDLVKHCNGKIRYWQNDSEPNNPIYWAGTPDEFVAELKVFYKAVKDADPSASVVAGGYDGLFNPPSMAPMPGQQVGLAFFDNVLKNGANFFDLFDLRLYANPYTIQGRVETMRQKMKALGYEKPIICTEYGGPGFFAYPVNRKYFPIVAAWQEAIKKQDMNGTAISNPIADLYKDMDKLAPETQMFMQGCSPKLQRKYDRIQGRDLVMRNILAFSAGVQKTLYWDFWNDASDRNNLMTLMYGKIMMMGFDGHTLTKRYPVADVFTRMAAELRGVRQVKQIPVEGEPSICLFQVDRSGRGPLYVVWDQRDSFSGEDSPPRTCWMPFTAKKAIATDVFGEANPAWESKGRWTLPVSVTPLYIEVG
jgi:hypothetical protein